MKLRHSGDSWRFTSVLLLALHSSGQAAAPEFPKVITLSQMVPPRPCPGNNCLYDPADYSTGYEVGTSAEQRLGEVLATGDFDKDGLQDLVMGTPNFGSGIGRVQVVFGSLSGWEESLSDVETTFVNISSKSTTIMELGSALAVGDLTGDGIDDVVMSAPSGTAPTVFLLPGRTARWGTTSIDVSSSSLVISIRDKSITSNLGVSLAIGDMTTLSSASTDGKADLLIGASSQEMAILVAGPITSSLDLSSDSRTMRFISTRGEELGKMVQFVPDLDKAGVPELAIAGPNNNNGSGRVYLIEGRSLSTFMGYAESNLLDISQVSFTRKRVFTLSAKYNGNNVGRFGSAMQGGVDFNRDGIQDLLIAAPEAPHEELSLPNVGRIYVLQGTSSTGSAGIYGTSSTTVNSTTSPSFQGTSSQEYLGARLSLGIDNGVDYPLILASTYLNLNTPPGGDGGFWLLSGRVKSSLTNMMKPDGYLFLPEAKNEQLGLSLLSGPRFDLDRDLFSEIVVGAPGYTSDLLGEIGRLYFIRTTDYIDNDLDGQTEAKGDCSDSNSQIAYQIINEICDGLDNDCDNLVDTDDSSVSGLVYRYADADRDGYGDPNRSFYGCPGNIPKDYVSNSSDCNDQNGSISPGAQEQCDGLDNDCDGAIDLKDSSVLSVEVWPDRDADGAGDEDAISEKSCPGDVPAGFSTTHDDCDDTRPDVSPEAAEICDALDNDCDGLIDDEDSDVYGNTQGGQVTLYPDQDGDGYGDADAPAGIIYRCSVVVGYSIKGGDCQDQVSNIYPDAPEGTIYSSTLSCFFPDGQDNDCDQLVDESTCESDDDQDTLSELEGDCNDTDPTIYEGASELCDDIDQDCDGDTRNEFDQDNDGYDDASLCPLDVMADCNDADATIYPGAPEQCNGLDDDCSFPDGSSSELNEADADGDGVFVCAGDCQDQNASIYPHAPELCDGVDNNCNGETDEVIDSDGDGSSQCVDCDDNDASVSPSQLELCDDKDNDCDGTPSEEEVDSDLDGTSVCEGDCDDNDPTRYPGKDEAASCNGIDDDCSGEADDALYFDGDQDGFLNAEACQGLSDALDCNDQVETIYPGAEEVAGDDIDQDCDGVDLAAETEAPLSPLPDVLVVDGLGCSCSQLTSEPSRAPLGGAMLLLGLIVRMRTRTRTRTDEQVRPLVSGASNA